MQVKRVNKTLLPPVGAAQQCSPAASNQPKWSKFMSLLLFLVLTLLVLMTLCIVNADTQPSAEAVSPTPSIFEAVEKPTAAAQAVRQAREADNAIAATPVTPKDSSGARQARRFYYEEQQPVVVHAESYGAPKVPFESPAAASQQQQPRTEDPYYDGEEYDQAPSGSAADANYDPYDWQSSQEDVAADDAQSDEWQAKARAMSEGRAAFGRGPNAYENARPWIYASTTTASPLVSRARVPPARQQAGGQRTLQLPPGRDAYGNYDTDLMEYDYDGPQWRHVQEPLTERPAPHQQQQKPQYARVPTAALQPTSRPQPPAESGDTTLMTIFRSLKMLWDLYQALSSAWNAMAVPQPTAQLPQHAQSQQQQQQQLRLRINSRRPPQKLNDNPNTKFAQKNATNSNTNTTTSHNNNNSGNGKNNSTTAKSTSTRTTTARATTARPATTTTSSKVEPRRGGGRKGDLALQKQTAGEREKRQVAQAGTAAADASEGRYIKGDPLKGYYDFVITEGSYKFWAVFQVGTAILIIYSTFAAIYYSKVNPLVSDYDYTDYLGGARSLGGGDLDFVDDDGSKAAAPAGKPFTQRLWQDWMPRMSHSVQFILDAIDKLPNADAAYESGQRRKGEQQYSEEAATEGYEEK